MHSNWQTKSVDISFPKDASWAIVYLNPTSKNCRLDNISFKLKEVSPKPTPKPDGNLISNGDFSKEKEGWQHFEGEFDIKSQNENLYAVIDKYAWVQYDIPYQLVKPKATYRLEATASYTNHQYTSGDCQVGIFGGASSQEVFDKVLSFTLAREQTKYIDITLPRNTDWLVVFLNSPDDCAIDDISLIKLGDNPDPNPNPLFETTVIFPSDAQIGHSISSVDLSENTLVLLRSKSSGGQSAAFIFDYQDDEWIEAQQINAELSPDPSERFFGFENVSIDRNTIVLHFEETQRISSLRFARSDFITYEKNQVEWEQVDRFSAASAGRIFPLLKGDTLFRVGISGEEIPTARIANYVRDGQGWRFFESFTSRERTSFEADANSDTIIYSYRGDNLGLIERQSNSWVESIELSESASVFAITEDLLTFIENGSLVTYSKQNNEAKWVKVNNLPIEFSLAQIQLDDDKLVIFSDDVITRESEVISILQMYSWIDGSWQNERRLELRHPNTRSLEDFEDGRIVLKDKLSSEDRQSAFEKIYIFE